MMTFAVTGVMQLKEVNVALRALGLELKKDQLKSIITEADKVYL